MGKKRIIKRTQEEILAEKDKIDQALKRGLQVKGSTKIQEGRIYIYSSYNNTMMTLTDSKGNVLAWTSAGSIGFKGTKKSTPFAASKVTQVIVDKAKKMGLSQVEVLVSGIGSGRNSALRSLGNYNLEITSIKDITPIPHNGCRPPVPRRV